MAVVVEDEVVDAVVVEVEVVVGVVVHAGRAERDPAALGGGGDDALGVVADEAVADPDVAALGPLLADRLGEVVAASPAHGVHRQGQVGALDLAGRRSGVRHWILSSMLSTRSSFGRETRGNDARRCACRPSRRTPGRSGRRRSATAPDGCRSPCVMSLKSATNWRNSVVVAVGEVEVVPLVDRGVARHVGRAHRQDVLGLAGLAEQVELRVQVAELVGRGPAALLALVDEASWLAVLADLGAHHLHGGRLPVVVEEHLHLHAATVGRDQRVGDRHAVEGVDRDPDRRALGGVLDGLDHPPLDVEVTLGEMGVVEEGAAEGLPLLRLRLGRRRGVGRRDVVRLPGGHEAHRHQQHQAQAPHEPRDHRHDPTLPSNSPVSISSPGPFRAVHRTASRHELPVVV